MNKKNKRACVCAAAMLLALTLTSCSGDVTVDSFFSFLGFDTYDYSAESVIRVCAADEQIVAALLDQTQMMSIDSPYLTPFTDFKTALETYRDSILNYMLASNYSKYTGNISMLDDAALKYPQMQITTLIPADEFEYTVYKCFGGSKKVVNESGVRFSYLPKIDAYTSVAQPQMNNITAVFISCAETENTYRLRFYNTLGDAVSSEYEAVFIKREDGTAYIKSLSETGAPAE